MIRSAAVAIVLIVASAVSAQEKLTSPPAAPTMEATLGEYANALWTQRNALELELASARATIKLLERMLDDSHKRDQNEEGKSP